MTMPRLAALSVALLALLIALPAPALAAFPVPSGGFSQPGFPQFAAGFWASVDPAVASVAFYSTAGYASQMDLNKTLISSLGYAKTFQCADNGTFVSIVTSRTVNPMTLQPVDEDYCLTGRIYPMGNFMVYAAIPVSAGFCADATDLSAIPVPVTQGAARQAIPPAPALPAGAIAGVYARIGNA